MISQFKAWAGRGTTRIVLLGLGFVLPFLTLVEVGFAQPWASKMFKATNHNFGTVARGAKAEFRFEFENIYEEDIHVAGVRSSCGCTTPSLSDDTLETWEKAYVLARFNTRSFLGHKSATVTVIIDRPYYAEVQLSVEGYIRSDVVFDPGEVNLGEVDPTEEAQARVSIDYAGRTDWQIIDVRSANRHFEVELDEMRRDSGRVTYEMLIRLKPGAPVGHFHDQLTLVTDDLNLQTFPLAVQGRVTSPITVSPATLFMGVLKPGESVTKQLVVRGKRPFRVLEVKCEDDCFRFEPSDEDARKLHLIAVTYTAGETPGKVHLPIEIETDLATGAAAACRASATVIESREP